MNLILEQQKKIQLAALNLLNVIAFDYNGIETYVSMDYDNIETLIKTDV
jgi:hypothetical protein